MTDSANARRQTETNTSQLAAASDYARRGLPVFPCKRADKKPLTRHGFKDATTDEAQIRQWCPHGHKPPTVRGLMTP
jgi:hypothetical protein